MMISPDDHLHSRSIVGDNADSGEKEPLRSETFVDSIHVGDQEEKNNLDKMSQEHKPLTKTSKSSPSGHAAEDGDHDNASLGHDGDNASTSSSSASSMSAHSSACTSTDEGRTNKSTDNKAIVGSGSDSAALRTRTKTLPTGYAAVYEPRPADILLGRGKPFQSHPGNQFMLHAVDQLRDQYLATDRKGKHNIIEHVLGLIKGRGGRFLVRIDENEENSPWMEVKRSISYRKVGHAFRSKARRAPPATGSLNPPEWLMQKESGLPRASSTGSSSRGHVAQSSRRGAEADVTTRLASKLGEDFVIGSPYLTTTPGSVVQGVKIPSPLSAKSRAQLKSGASTGVAPFIKGLESRGTHSRITAVNPLLRLPDRLPASSGHTRLVQGDEDKRLPIDQTAVWALQQQHQQQQQQQQHLMTLNNMVALEQRIAAQHDAVLALRDREQQILNLLSHPQPTSGQPGSIIQGASSSLPLLQAEAAALRFQSRLPQLPTTGAVTGAFRYNATHATTNRLFGSTVNEYLLSGTSTSAGTSQKHPSTSSTVLSPLAGAFATGGASSNFLLDPGTTSAAELLILEQQRRRELMQRDFMANQQLSWAGAVAAAAASVHQQQLHLDAAAAAARGGQLRSSSLTITNTNTDSMVDIGGSSTRSLKKRKDDYLENEESAATMSPSSKKKRQTKRGNS